MPPYDALAAISPLDLLLIGLSTPLFSLILAALLTPVLLVLAGRRRPSRSTEGARATEAGRYRAEQGVAGIAAAAVIAVFVFEYLVPGYVFALADVVEWWKYATPVAAAGLGVAAVLVTIMASRSSGPDAPVLIPSRRTWRSFGPQRGLVVAVVAVATLVATTIAAGSASSADSRGRFIHLELAVPNEVGIDPVQPWFYGWSFGVPVLVASAALTLATWATLRANAVRPFRRPETVAAEHEARSWVATAVVRTATGGVLLALGGAWRFIAEAGSISRLVIDGGPQGGSYDTTWRYAEFAMLAGWLAPAIEIAGFVLLLSAMRGLGGARLQRGGAGVQPTADAVTAR